ncbi:MAG TPA: SGNH/GDSL hydrolase family protein [Fimbriimonadaceae bacterium]|jgi:lysophospholipase L1-like esterase
MLRLPLLVATFIVPFIANAQMSQPTLPTKLQNVHRIVMLGDSITQFGEGPKGYVWLTRHYLQDLYPSQNFEVINAGISGHKSNDMLKRFQHDVLDKNPDLVTISVGVNDVWHGFNDSHPNGDGPEGVSLDEYKKNVESMVSQALAQKAQVVILASTVIGEDLNGKMNAKAGPYNAALREIARNHNLLYVDYQKPFRTLITDYRKTTGGKDLLLTVDGVHMNDEGNQVMAHTLLTALGVRPDDQAKANQQIHDQEQAH